MSDLKLPRLPTDFQDQPTLHRRYWDLLCNKTEQAINAILNIPSIQTALDTLNTDVTAAQTAANTAQTAANTAQTAANTAGQVNSIINSYPSGYTGDLVTATSAGVVTIANHQRVFGDSGINPTVSVTGGSITTTATSGQVVRIYYDDPGYVGGAVTYHYTIDPATAPVQGGSRFVVGAIAIPASGSSPGTPLRAPGFITLQ